MRRARELLRCPSAASPRSRAPWATLVRRASRSPSSACTDALPPPGAALWLSAETNVPGRAPPRYEVMRTMSRARSRAWGSASFRQPTYRNAASSASGRVRMYSARSSRSTSWSVSRQSTENPGAAYDKALRAGARKLLDERPREGTCPFPTVFKPRLKREAPGIARHLQRAGNAACRTFDLINIGVTAPHVRLRNRMERQQQMILRRIEAARAHSTSHSSLIFGSSPYPDAPPCWPDASEAGRRLDRARPQQRPWLNTPFADRAESRSPVYILHRATLQAPSPATARQTPSPHERMACMLGASRRSRRRHALPNGCIPPPEENLRCSK